MVRKSASVLAILLLMAAGMASAAHAEISSNITVNPLGFIGWGPDIEFETAMGDTNALAVRGKFGGWTLGDWTTTSVGGGLSWRFYLNDDLKAPRGLYVGPSVDILSVTSSIKDGGSGTSMIYSIYGQLGYKWIFGQKVGFVLSPYINLGYNMGSVSATNSLGDSDSVSFSGFLFGLGLAIGIGF
ncbi:MAG: hypothetical protein AB1439_00035 [candidate division FCPU426 bacterium]